MISLDNIEFELQFDDPRLLAEDQVTVKGDRKQLELLSDVVESYVQNFLHQTRPPLNSVNLEPNHSPRNPITPPSLSPQGLLTHHLALGSLASQASHASVTLSISQLFDLLNALDAYSNTIITLTTPKTSPLRKSVGVWVAAGSVALLALLIPTVGIKWFRQMTAGDNPSEAITDNGENPLPFSEVLPPVPPPPKTPLPAPSLAPSLASRDPLPPPGQIGEGTPPPRNATVAIQAPPLRVLPPPPVAPPAPPKPNTASSVNPSVSVEEVPPHLLPSGEPPIVMPSLPADTRMQLMQQPTLPPPPILQAKNLTQPSPSERATMSIPDEVLSPAAKVTPKPPPETSLLDTIPQVAEVRQYFQEQWQPPENLTQTLEYRLVLEEDGSLKQTIPLGRTAAIYRPRIPFPAPGSSFVSPLDVSSNETIRLVLIPNGKVKTLLE